MRKNRGMSMLMVMFFALLATVLAAVIAGMSFAPSNLSGKFNYRMQCENLTQSVLADVFARLKADPAFRGTVIKREGDSAYAVVTFDAGDASRYDVPVSVNALSVEAPSAGTAGRVLPTHSAQLFARARVGSSHSLCVEQVVCAPRFPYCIASSSGIVASGPMLVAGTSEGGGEADKPGHIAGNGNVVLRGPSTRVTGDVKASGSVSRDFGVAVEGMVQEQHSEVVLPLIPIAAYDPGSDPLVVRALSGSSPDLTIDGLARCDGDLLVNTNGIVLDNGLLYVIGNLEVYGGVKGRGAIFCTGSVTIHGGSDLETTNLCAIVAHGQVTLSAAGSGNAFRGLVYTETGMEASDLKLVGAFLCRTLAGAGGELTLRNCDVTYDPEAVQFEWEIPGFGPGSKLTNGGARLGDGRTAADFLLNGHFDNSIVDGNTVPFVFRGQEFSSASQAADAARASNLPVPVRRGSNGAPGSRYSSWDEFYQEDQDRYRAMLSIMDQQYQASKSESLKQGKFSLDLNQFLSASDSLRVMFWRDLN